VRAELAPSLVRVSGVQQVKGPEFLSTYVLPTFIFQEAVPHLSMWDFAGNGATPRNPILCPLLRPRGKAFYGTNSSFAQSLAATSSSFHNDEIGRYIAQSGLCRDRVHFPSASYRARQMATFTVTLPDGNTLSGANYFPGKVGAAHISARPLIVAVHGGSYTSDYFDADENHSIRHFSQSLGIPVIAIDRPSYRRSTPLPATLPPSSFIQDQGRYLHQTILPFLWNQHASSLGCSSIFLYAHSIGGAIAVVTASLHASSQQPALYPLCGISISGVGSNVNRLPMDEEFAMDRQQMKGISLRFPSAQKDAMMLGPSHLYGPAILAQTERLQHEILLEELHDINVLWPEYWRKYAAKVEVTVLYTLGEYDSLWKNTEQDVREFAAGFGKATSVEAKRLLLAPHCIEHSLQATGLILRTFGFAIESAVQLKLRTLSDG
jgi:pimeloyl-ACP methyl ester carboxylesterase